jgi:hypothetical protein
MGRVLVPHTYFTAGTYIHILGVHKFYKKFRSHLKFLGARRVRYSAFHTEDPQILGATVQNLVDWVIWRPVFMHPCHILRTGVT